jgi:hypothetical protein
MSKDKKPDAKKVTFFKLARAISEAGEGSQKVVKPGEKGGVIVTAIGAEFDGKASVEMLLSYFEARNDANKGDPRALYPAQYATTKKAKRGEYLAGYLQWLVGNGNLERVVEAAE